MTKFAFSCGTDGENLYRIEDDQLSPYIPYVARILRSRGIPCEVAPTAARLGKQIRFADRRGIPYVWFSGGEVKDIRTGEQTPADAQTWEPSAEDRWPQVTQG